MALRLNSRHGRRERGNGEEEIVRRSGWASEKEEAAFCFKTFHGCKRRRFGLALQNVLRNCPASFLAKILSVFTTGF